MLNNILIGFLGLGGQEIIWIVVIVLLLFGGRKIPELMRGLGQGIKEFKNASKGNEDSSKNQTKDSEKIS